MSRFVAVFLLLAFWARVVDSAEGPASNEYAVKAAFIYNFTRFVDWPPDAQGDAAPFVVTVLGLDPFGSALDDALSGKAIGNRKVVLRRVSRIQDVGKSQILFISATEKDRLALILTSLGTNATLTVGDMDHFAAQGGVIGFKVDEKRIRLEISVAAAERSGLKISSQLLRVAQVVVAGNGS